MRITVQLSYNPAYFLLFFDLRCNFGVNPFIKFVQFFLHFGRKFIIFTQPASSPRARFNRSRTVSRRAACRGRSGHIRLATSQYVKCGG